VFFLTVFEMSVARANSSRGFMDYSFLDSACKLVMIFLKTEIESSKEEIFEVVTSAIHEIMLAQHESPVPFSPRPFFRLLFNLLCDISREEYNFEDSNRMALLSILCKLLEKVEPLKMPSFAFSWLTLLSYRFLLPVVLAQYDSWDQYYELLRLMLTFTNEVITPENYEVAGLSSLYADVLKLMATLLMDHPDFLCEFSYPLEELIHERFLQLRNIVQNAIPRQTKLDPRLTLARLKDMDLEGIRQLPRYYRPFFRPLIDEHGLQVPSSPAPARPGPQGRPPPPRAGPRPEPEGRPRPGPRGGGLPAPQPVRGRTRQGPRPGPPQDPPGRRPPLSRLARPAQGGPRPRGPARAHGQRAQSPLPHHPLLLPLPGEIDGQGRRLQDSPQGSGKTAPAIEAAPPLGTCTAVRAKQAPQSQMTIDHQ
jgi:hypothetical protein